jgi:hypothetical protein
MWNSTMEYYSDLEAFMEFYQEPHHFEKTFFSDLQEALANLPAAVANNLCNLMETIKTTK